MIENLSRVKYARRDACIRHVSTDSYLHSREGAKGRTDWGNISFFKRFKRIEWAFFRWSDTCALSIKSNMKTTFVSLAIALGLSSVVLAESKQNSILLPASPVSTVLKDTVPGKTIYKDLGMGETVEIWYDAVGLRTLNKKTGAPIEFYVNTSTRDTVFGRGRFVVNSYILKGDDGKWKLDDGKVKVDGDELKVKVGNQKFKIDGDEIKIKGNGIKAKSDDGEIKVKSPEGKAKFEDDKTKVKTKDATKDDK